MTTIKLIEFAMYGFAAFGIGAALAGIYSVGRAFIRKQDHLYQQTYQAFVNQKSLAEKHLRDTKPT